MSCCGSRSSWTTGQTRASASRRISTAQRQKSTAPSGAIWEWNEASESGLVEGSAHDFCLTVTQVRNVADTALRVEGDVAQQWMAIAQCFAGGAEDPPEPGARVWR